MKKLLFLLFIATGIGACSKDKKTAEPGDNFASVKIGSNVYSFSTVPDPAANYYDQANASLQFKLVGEDGISSLQVRCMYLETTTTPFLTSGTTGPGPSVQVIFTNAAGMVYDDLVIDETPWMAMTFTKIVGQTWEGVFHGYSNNAAGDRIDLQDGKFKVVLANR